MVGCVPALALAFPDAPPAAVTGGFGEDGCHACHFEFDVGSGDGGLQVSGWPAYYEPGKKYQLRLALKHSGMMNAGFQLAIRDGDGAQAGVFLLTDDADEPIGVQTQSGVDYAQHTSARLGNPEEGRRSWQLTWQAPGDDRAVMLHVSAVAGDGDGSQVGDYVYQLSLGAEPL
jgi:hypothetical protein